MTHPDILAERKARARQITQSVIEKHQGNVKDSSEHVETLRNALEAGTLDAESDATIVEQVAVIAELVDHLYQTKASAKSASKK